MSEKNKAKEERDQTIDEKVTTLGSCEVLQTCFDNVEKKIADLEIERAH